VTETTKQGKKRKKRKTRRSEATNPALQKKFTIKSRQEFLETEYTKGVYDDEGRELIRPLTKEEQAWLNKFYTEDLNASFNHEDPLYKTKEERKKAYDANNARNRDIYNIQNSMGMLDELTEESFGISHQLIANLKDEIDYEINDYLDKKHKREREGLPEDYEEEDDD